MKKQLAIYGILIILFIIYNFFLKVDNDRINTAINIVITSIIFGYISYMALVLLKKMKNKE